MSNKRKVKLRMIVEYEVEYPSDFDDGDIEFHRNDSSWCVDNVITELQRIKEERGSCLCGCTTFEVVEEINLDNWKLEVIDK